MIPSFPEAQRAKMMDEAAAKLVETIKRSGAEPVFFQTWGRRDGDKQNAATFPNDTFGAMQKRLIRGYTKVAQESGGAHVIPIGELWAFVMKDDRQRGLKFYQKDGSHPSKAGVSFAANIIFSALYNEVSDEKISSSAIFSPLAYPLK